MISSCRIRIIHTLTPQQWIKATDAIGIVSKSGRYGGTYAHTDIAFEFVLWISPEFKLYIIKDYQRLKKDEVLLFEENPEKQVLSSITKDISYISFFCLHKT